MKRQQRKKFQMLVSSVNLRETDDKKRIEIMALTSRQDAILFGSQYVVTQTATRLKLHIPLMMANIFCVISYAFYVLQPLAQRPVPTIF